MLAVRSLKASGLIWGWGCEVKSNWKESGSCLGPVTTKRLNSLRSCPDTSNIQLNKVYEYKNISINTVSKLVCHKS